MWLYWIWKGRRYTWQLDVHYSWITLVNLKDEGEWNLSRPWLETSKPLRIWAKHKLRTEIRSLLNSIADQVLPAISRILEFRDSKTSFVFRLVCCYYWSFCGLGYYIPPSSSSIDSAIVLYRCNQMRMLECRYGYVHIQSNLSDPLYELSQNLQLCLLVIDSGAVINISKSIIVMKSIGKFYIPLRPRINLLTWTSRKKLANLVFAT